MCMVLQIKPSHFFLPLEIAFEKSQTHSLDAP